MTTDFETIIPKQILFQLKELEELGIIKIKTAKKFIDNGLINAVKIGNRLHVTRVDLIKYLNDRVISKAGA